MNKAMCDKITIKKYFQIHYSVFVELFRNYKKQSVILLTISLLTIASNVINLSMIQYLTNIVSAHLKQGIDDYISIFTIIGVMIIFLLVIQFFQNIFNKVDVVYRDKISSDIEKKIVLKLSEIPYDLYESQSFYEKINLANQVNVQYSNAIYAISQMIQIITHLIVYTILLAKLHWLYIIISTIALVVSSILSAKMTDRQLDFWRKKVSPCQRVKEYFQGIYSNRINHSCIQVNRNLSYFINMYEMHIKKERTHYLQLNAYSFVSEFGASSIFIVTFLVTLLATGRQVVEGNAEIGYFTMVMALLVNVYNIIKQFTMFMMNSNWYVRVIDCYNEVMSIEPIMEKEGAKGISENCLSFDSLKYKYPQSDTYALNDISQKFAFGEKIAIVGYNGSGKTTLISIISDLLTGYEGAVNKNDISIMSIGQQFGEYQLSIRENIELGRGGNKMEEKDIDDILLQIGMKEFVDSLPQGIDTVLGQLEAGVNLSKGQWQRIAIGRLLANPEANVWILDEPTAYLDPISEINLYRFVLKLAGNRLVFFVSHRLGFARFADRIMVLQDGNLVESGSHETLIKEQNSLYARMYWAQKEWYE